jgi:hypothetical protein
MTAIHSTRKFSYPTLEIEWSFVTFHVHFFFQWHLGHPVSMTRPLTSLGFQSH